MLGRFTFSTLAACAGPWLIAWAVMSAAAITGFTSGVLYSQPSIGHLMAGILGPRGGAS